MTLALALALAAVAACAQSGSKDCMALANGDLTPLTNPSFLKGLNSVDPANKKTPLACALQSRDGKVVQAVVNAGASPNAIIGDGTSYLVDAIESRDTAAVTLLLQAGADPNLQPPEALGPPLVIAVQYNDEQSVLVLIEKGASLNQANSMGMTPLMAALSMRNLSAAKLLLSKGADVCTVDERGANIREYMRRSAVNITESGARELEVLSSLVEAAEVRCSTH